MTDGKTVCASLPGQQCIVSNFGDTPCGWNCAQSINTVKCAQHRRDNCIADNFGNVQCGRNCRIDFGQIKCDRYR
jgi:hypothetical protein